MCYHKGLSSNIDKKGSSKVKKLCPESDEEDERVNSQPEGSQSKSTLFDGDESDDDMDERLTILFRLEKLIFR
jgi:hypothetical protein